MRGQYKILLIFRIIILGSFCFFSASAYSQNAERSVLKSGPFSLMPFGGLESLNAVNGEGENTKFSGTTYGLRAVLRPLPDTLKGFQLFVDGSMAKGTNELDEVEELSTSTVRFGFTQYLAYFLYVGGFYGYKNIEVTNSIPSEQIDAEATITGIGLGLDLLTIGESWALSLEAWQYSGYAPRNTNQGYNLGTNSAEYYLGIRWSPTVTLNW